MTTRETVYAVLVSHLGLGVDEVVPTARLVEDLGADSLDLVELAIELEARLHLEIPDEDCDGFDTVEDLVTYLEGCTA